MNRAKALNKSPVETILRPGQMVGGQYRVDHLLGQGGMAAVWAGTNEHTGKRVALKVILLSLASTGEAQSLFRSEALAASRVNHPNVVTVFDVIEHDGMACIVMELLDGEPLSSYLARKGFFSVDEAAALLLPAMRGVAAANAQGVIHRDLKPQNIFVCTEPDGRIVTTKVLDFGISVMMERVIDPSAGPDASMAAGTPAYMSPEHILRSAHIDGRADVYGFGVLLYETLTGQMPFPGEPGPELFDRILNQPLPSVTLLRPDLPPGLVRIIERAMAKQPDQRYSDLDAMVNALEDELMQPTPPPRLLTPFAGVPAIALRDPASGEHAVQAILKKELSEQHQETRVLFAFPPEGDSRRRTSHAKPVPTDPRPSLRKVVLAGSRPLSAPRFWNGLLGAGFAVALGFFAVWMIIGSATRAQTRAPSPAANAAPLATEPASKTAIPAIVSNATAVSVAFPAPSAASPSPPEMDTPVPVKPSKPTSHAHAMRASGTSAKSAALRASRLTRADF